MAKHWTELNDIPGIGFTELEPISPEQAQELIGKTIKGLEFDTEADKFPSILAIILNDGTRLEFTASDYDSYVYMDLVNG